VEYVDVVAAESRRISEVARRGPLTAPVPHIPGWTMESVVAHLGGVHRWAARTVRTRLLEGSHVDGQHTGEALLSWFDEGAQELVDTLLGVDPKEPCPNFSRGSQETVFWWHRRQAHETTMHRWDVEAAAGDLTPIATEFADDGIDELFHTFTRARGKQVLAGPLVVRTTDTGSAWTLVPADKPGRVDLTTEEVSPIGVLSGPAEQLLLALWKRIPLDDPDIAIEGDAGAVRAFVAGPIAA
jgi:uncharacterized protein (TIGR03083 family)